jgi:alpha-mannosidase
VLRSPRFADHGMGWGDADPLAYPMTAQGRHRCSFRLHPHAGGDMATAARVAAEHCVELPFVLDSWHHGRLGPSREGIRLAGAQSLALGAVKRAEDGAGAVLRVFETAGRPWQGGLDFELYGRRYEGSWRAHEVKTLYLPDDPTAAPREIDIPELEDTA